MPETSLVDDSDFAEAPFHRLMRRHPRFDSALTSPTDAIRFVHEDDGYCRRIDDESDVGQFERRILLLRQVPETGSHAPAERTGTAIQVRLLECAVFLNRVIDFRVAVGLDPTAGRG